MDIDINIDTVLLENIDINIDIDKAILHNIDIDKVSNRFKFGISNRARGEQGNRFEIEMSGHGRRRRTKREYQQLFGEYIFLFCMVR